MRSSKDSMQDNRRDNCLLREDEVGSSSSFDSGLRSRPGRCSVELLPYTRLVLTIPSQNERGRTHLAHGHRLLGTCRLLSDGSFIHSCFGVETSSEGGLSKEEEGGNVTGL